MTRSEACPPSREGGGQAGIECSRARLRILVSHEPPSSRKKAMLNRLLPVLVIGAGLLLAGTVSSCSSTPSQSASTSPAPSYSANDATRVTAPALFAAYKNHKAASDELYKGRLLEVTGTVDAVGTDSMFQAPEVMLSSGATTQAPGVDCIFDTRYAARVAKLQKGAKLAVLGTCDGYAVNVLLLHCQPSQE